MGSLIRIQKSLLLAIAKLKLQTKQLNVNYLIQGQKNNIVNSSIEIYTFTSEKNFNVVNLLENLATWPPVDCR